MTGGMGRAEKRLGETLGTRHKSHVTFQMFGLFKKFKEGFAKTVSAISDQTAGIFFGRRIDPDSLDELEEALYTADFGVETT